ASRMVTTRRSVSSVKPPVKESLTQRVYPRLSDAEESSNEDEEIDDHEESSTTHLDAVELNASSSTSFNSSSSSFNRSSFSEADLNYVHVFVGLLVVCLVYWLIAGRSRPEPTRPGFGKLLGTVIKAYPAFSAHDRAQLGSAADRWFDNSTKDPVVVIIYATDASSSLLDDLATSTASFLGKRTTVVTSTTTTQRAHLHGTFENTLRGGAKSTIGLREIEKLPWDTPLVLHTFADADHIATSRPFIWLQVSRDDSLKGLSCDDAITRTLTSSWLASGGNVDNVAPVISRVLQFTVCLDWP
ncbi:hypothetical protein PMAYCL1PPCAC_04372, partial [Pristionchus mayeri]